MRSKQLRTDISVTVRLNTPFLPQVFCQAFCHSGAIHILKCFASFPRLSPHTLAALPCGLVGCCSTFSSNTNAERSGLNMLDQVSRTVMDPSFQIMFDFAEGTFNSFPIALGLSGPLEAHGISFPTRWRNFRQTVSALLLPKTPAFPRQRGGSLVYQ